MSNAQQSVTTLGGTSYGRGQSLVGGGFNSNRATGALSQADQQVLTIGGAGHGRDLVSGGRNRNAATGFGSSASQQVTTVSGQ